MINQSITSLAILKVNWDERHIDYIESFLPLFLNLIRIKHYEKIVADTVRKDFENEYGLSIPHHPIMAILGRLRSKGFIKKEIEGFVPNYSQINNSNFNVVSDDQSRKLQKLISTIIEFSAKHGVVLDEEAAGGALLGFFRENELSILFATEDKNILPDAEVNKSTKFLVAKFIHSAKKSEPQLFQFLVDIAIGSALAATVVYGNGLKEHFAGKMKNLNLYLDSGYLFSLLGVDGEEDKTAFEELTHNLVNDGAKIKVFEHTYDEMMGIFTSALYWMKQKNYEINKASRTLKYFVINEFTETDVEMFIAQVPHILETFKIEKIPKPEYDRDITYQIGESQLKTLIIEAYKLDDPFFDEIQKEETINKDVESVYSICKLRKGKVAFTLHDASHIFITTNRLLAKTSSHIQSSDNVPFSFPPCITDVFIGTLLWLQNPTKAVALNEKRIIADAYAAIQPDPQLIKKYLDQIELLKKKGDISDNEYYVLRTHRVAFNLLSETTKNDINNFGPKTTTQILDEINRGHISSLKLEVEQEKISHKKTAEILEKQQQVIQQKDEWLNRSNEKSEKLLRFIVSFLTWIILPAITVIIIAILIINSFPSIFPNLLLRILAFVIVAALTLIGFNLKVTKALLEKEINRFVLKYIIK